MAQFDFSTIEKKWQKKWKEDGIYKVVEDTSKPKCYVLDMFPYPSGSGLHVGHPLGYIASDIYARYKRLKGFNVLHPMGFDAFGLPAEQYAVETGQHPDKTTKENIARYKEQLEKIGFCFDWSREVKTADPSYYKWTQWIFLQLFNSYYDTKLDKAQPISSLLEKFKADGLLGVFSAEDWQNFSQQEKENILMDYRLAYRKVSHVNWCEALGTVLANDEVVNGVSERGGHPVERKEMMQWFLRITAYADRLLASLNDLDFPEPLKDMQRNWIGKSEGALVHFEVDQHNEKIEVFTTRPDTLFGTSFLVLAPEHALVNELTTADQKEAVAAYQSSTSKRSERERMADTKKISGCFTGAFALHPFTKEKLPIWIADYVLAHYGTGAIMAVPAGDERDFAFAQHFELEVPNIFANHDLSSGACTDKNSKLTASGFLTDLIAKEAIPKALDKIEQEYLGSRKINFKLRDAGFSRQRYWGEPFPIRYQTDGTISEEELPHLLPVIDTYDRGPEGKGPLAHLAEWVSIDGAERETDTMPGYAGSSWYYLRYMDPNNENEFCAKEKSDYWNQVDLYVGGAEHAVGHLLYSRFWCKFLHDLDFVSFDEPYKKLVNQGMIQGKGYFGRIKYIEKKRVTNMKDSFHTTMLLYSADIEHENDILNRVGNPDDFQGLFTEKSYLFRMRNFGNYVSSGNKLYEKDFVRYKKENPTTLLSKYHFDNTEVIWDFDKNNEKYISLREETEKMSKSKYNVVNPDDIIKEYGADTFRMYEMFLGPIEDSKPWDTKGIEGVHRFLKKLWRLFYHEDTLVLNDTPPSPESLKTLHQTIEKIEKATESFSLNTAVSQFMICVNELSQQKCQNREILKSLLILLAPYAPYTAQELWEEALGNEYYINDEEYPILDKSYLVEDEVTYPIAINGKRKMELKISADLEQKEVEELVLALDEVQNLLDGKTLRKFIFVKGRMINLVV